MCDAHVIISGDLRRAAATTNHSKQRGAAASERGRKRYGSRPSVGLFDSERGGELGGSVGNHRRRNGTSLRSYDATMGNPLPRTQSLTRQKNSAPKWDSFSKQNRPHALFSNRGLPSTDKVRSFISGELTSTGRSRAFLSGELPLVRPPASATPPVKDAATNTGLKDAATNTDDSVSISGDDGRSVKSEVQDKREDRPVEKRELLAKKNRDERSGNRGESLSRSLRRSASAGVSTTTTTSVQSEKEGSHSRLLSRGGESSSFRGRTSSSSRRDVSGSFRKDTVSSSFRKEVSHTRRKSTKSFHDGEASSIASESVRGSPCSIHYSQGPFSAKMTPQPLNSSWISETPSSPEGFYSSVPFNWEEAPGKAKTIAAAAEMALARKLCRDESLRKLNAASPRSSVDGSVQGERRAPSSRRTSLEPVVSAASAALPLPPSKREFSRELTQSQKKDPHASQLIEELKAAVVRKQADNQMTRERTLEKDDDNKSVISDFGPTEEAHIDLVAPSAAKFLTQEDDMPILTPIKTPAAVPFKWEEAPGKPKGNASPPSEPEPPQLSLPPRLLGGCRNLSKEAQAKILQTYSCNLSEMHWTASGNPTPLSRSRDHTPTRRDRTPTRRDRTPTRRDTTPTRRDVTPSRRDSTPTRSYFSNVRIVPKSGPISYPSAMPVIENVRDFHSGPLRPNSVGPNYLNAPQRSISQEFAVPIVVPARAASQDFHPPKNPAQENAVNVLTHELSLSGPSSEDSERRSYASRKACRDAPLPPRQESSAQVSQDCGAADTSSSKSTNDAQSGASAKPAAGSVDHWSPTSILCGPDLSVDTNRSNSNLSAYAESSHSQRQSVTTHTKSNSCTSEESYVDEIYDPQPWSGSITPVASPYRDLGPIDTPPESTQANKALEEGVKALVKFCRKAKKWNRSKSLTRKNSQLEPDMWAPTLATYFQKLELGGINKVGSQIYPEDKSLRSIYGPGGEASVARSPAAKFIPRSGELGTPDRLALRRALGGQTPIQTIAACRSPTYRVLATDECFSLFSVQKVWNSTRARHAKWGKKMRRSSRVMASICAALKRSLMLKCGRHNLPTLPSDSKLLSREEAELKGGDAVHALHASHQFHRPL